MVDGCRVGNQKFKNDQIHGTAGWVLMQVYSLVFLEAKQTDPDSTEL